jgi:hypothetical protein
LNESARIFQSKHREAFFSAISAGFFLLSIGMIFIITPNLFDKIVSFFNDLAIVRVTPNIVTISPVTPSAHSTVYTAIMQFSLVWGIFQIAILILRFVARSPLTKKAETSANLVFWLGAYYLISLYLNKTTTAKTWFEFWTLIIMLAGVSLIVRAVILAARVAVS